MAELGIEEAAKLYGVAPETIWHAIQDGQLAARIDPMGRYLVTVPPPAPPAAAPPIAAPAPSTPSNPQLYTGSDAERLRQELEYTRYLLAEVSHQRDQLEAQVQAQLRQLERAEDAQHELRVLIGSAMRPGDNALRQVDRPVAGGLRAPAKRHRWWRF